MAGHDRSMQLRLWWILPTLQLIVALLLLQWGRQLEGGQGRFDTLYVPTPALVCKGINAPATALAGMAFFFDRVDHQRPTILGSTLDYPLFLIGVLILWYLVGKALDSWRSTGETPLAWTWPRLVFFGGPLAVLGALFLYEGLQGFRDPWRWNNRTGNIMHSVLVLLWSIVLIGVPGLKLIQRLRMSK